MRAGPKEDLIVIAAVVAPSWVASYVSTTWKKRLQVVSVRACFNKGGRNQLAQSVPYHILRQYFEVEVRTFVRYPQIVVALLLRQSPLCMAFLCVELKR